MVDVNASITQSVTKSASITQSVTRAVSIDETIDLAPYPLTAVTRYLYDVDFISASDGASVSTIPEQIVSLDASQGTTANQAIYQLNDYAKPVLKFDGADDYYTVGTVSTFNFLHEIPAAGCTVAAAIALDITQSEDGEQLSTIFSNSLSSNDRGIGMIHDTRGGVDRFRFLVSDGAGNLRDAKTTINTLGASETGLITIVHTYDDAEWTWYLNATVENSSTEAAPAASGDAAFIAEIGRSPTSGGTGPHDGAIRHLAIADEIWTPSQVTEFHDWAIS